VEAGCAANGAAGRRHGARTEAGCCCWLLIAAAGCSCPALRPATDGSWFPDMVHLRQQRAAVHLCVVGDVFCDISATGLTALPRWGGDVAVERPIRMLPGGSGLNSAVLLASLQREYCRGKLNVLAGSRTRHAPGVHTVLYAPLSDDAFGTLIRSKAREAGVALVPVRVRAGAGTGRTAGAEQPGTGVCVVLGGWTDAARTRLDRTFVTHYGVVGAMCAADLPPEATAAADHVHISGYYNFKTLGYAGCAEIFARARAGGGGTSLCAQYDSREVWDGIPQLCRDGLLDLLFVNEDEAAALTGRRVREVGGGIDEAAAEAAGLSLVSMGAGLVVVTLGASGAVALGEPGVSILKSVDID
jgi:sugar/nucleoside kinase (ribokinase family)